MDGIDRRDGTIAVEYARDVIDEYLRSGTTPDPPTDDGALADDRGAFVTLQSDGDLRGCIGRPYPRQPGYEAIRQGAIGAATEDPRFPPVTGEELSNLTVEISILGTPDPVAIESDRPDDVVEVGRDGLIVSGENTSGLLLPQVAVEHEWTVEEFLEHTCRKAGLVRDCWCDPDLQVERFSAAVFAEIDPDGSVRPVQLEEAKLA